MESNYDEKLISKVEEIKQSERKTPREQLLNLSSLYLEKRQPEDRSEHELEVRFGTKGVKYLTNQDLNNVVTTLLSRDYRLVSRTEDYCLKIFPITIDPRTGKRRSGENFRIEIYGMDAIQEYCRTDDIYKVKSKYRENVHLKTKKNYFKNDKLITPVEYNDFNFRVSYQLENTISRGPTLDELVTKWGDYDKTFRLIKRNSYIKSTYLSTFSVDISIVKSSSRHPTKGYMIETSNIKDSNVFNNRESYEIEIEVGKKQNLEHHGINTPEQLTKEIEQISKLVLSGLQQTNYPISYPEQYRVQTDYYELIHRDDKKEDDKKYTFHIRTDDFIGPSSKTLQIKNICPVNPDIMVPNINVPDSYCVTEKADGLRCLLYVNNNGKIYLINMNMSVMFTGAKTTNEKCFNSILDGELILRNRKKEFINLFAAFDIYYINSIDVRTRPFIQIKTKDVSIFKQGCRLPMLKEFVSILDPVSVVKLNTKATTLITKSINTIMDKSLMESSPIKIVSKRFYPSFDRLEDKEADKISGDISPVYNIFEACDKILQQVDSDQFEYDVDGLIFTPTLLGVGGNNVLECGPKNKITWEYSFKWKPEKFNTVDFLVSIKKDANNADIVNPIFKKDIDMYKQAQFTQYKTLILAVGFDEKQHGYLNPYNDLLTDKIPEILQRTSTNKKGNYRAQQFVPSDPYDPTAGICNVILRPDNNNNLQILTEENEIITDNSVVEFRYDIDGPPLMKWVPLRIRPDKTNEAKLGDSFGNDYKTANSNWYSIHNPITRTMICTGNEISIETVSEDIYYNASTSEKNTRGMRDFHNLYVKKMLISSVSKRDNTLIDYACGKGGDIPKWTAGKLKFVFGIDISSDNIENRKDGACSRYLTSKGENKQTPYCIFVNGDSSINIRSGNAIKNEKAKQITQSIFGSINVNKDLGPAVERQHAVGMDGFNISSCQFAIHYMFENKHKFYNFIRNVADCTKINGYFIGTCYDGLNVFNTLKRKKSGESEYIYLDETKKVWSITKNYSISTFEDSIESLGQEILVYQDSINQTIPEYLVNFRFLISEMDKFGLKVISKSEASQLGLPNGSGTFEELYNQMLDEIDKYPQKETEYKSAPTMRSYEKKISFLNRYFVFKKIRVVNTETLIRTILEHTPDEMRLEDIQTKIAEKSVQNGKKEIEVEKKSRVKKLTKKITLQEATEAVSNNTEPYVEQVKPVITIDTLAPIEEPMAAPIKEKKQTTRKKKLLIINDNNP